LNSISGISATNLPGSAADQKSLRGHSIWSINLSGWSPAPSIQKTIPPNKISTYLSLVEWLVFLYKLSSNEINLKRLEIKLKKEKHFIYILK